MFKNIGGKYWEENIKIFFDHPVTVDDDATAAAAAAAAAAYGRAVIVNLLFCLFSSSPTSCIIWRGYERY